LCLYVRFTSSSFGFVCAGKALFGGVHGGSVLDDDHMGALVESLESLPGKGAVCFFFKEHVVAVLKLAGGRVRL
jgi:hypothetical protein